MLKRFCLTFGISALFLTPAQSIAQTAPSLPASDGWVDFAPYSPSIFDTYSPAESVTKTHENTTVSISVSGGGSVSATTSNPSYQNVAYPQADLHYYFEVYGPKNTTVSLTASGIIGSGFQSQSDQSYAGAYLSVFGSGTPIATVAACASNVTCTGYYNTVAPTNQIFVPGTAGYVLNALSGIYQASYNVNFNVLTNTAYDIRLGAYVTIGGGGSLLGSGTAYVDPTLTISPTFLSSNPGYQIAFSEGISQASGVPEASTWAMMLAGFAGLGFVGYRRNKGAALAA